MTIAEMRTLLGLGSGLTDAEVVEAYAISVGLGLFASLLADAVAEPVDPFAAALDALFFSPGSSAAIYTPNGGPAWPDPIRVIRSRPDVAANFGETPVIIATNIFEVRRSEVPELDKGDVLQLGALSFRTSGEAMSDVEGLTWAIGAEEVT